MFESLLSLFHLYRVGTGVYLLSGKERTAWDITFLLLVFLFFVGVLKLSISSYQSFVRVFFGDLVAPSANEYVKN